ncbi:MAG: DUF2235 domain-containing protein [Pseudomonadota bacterium]
MRFWQQSNKVLDWLSGRLWRRPASDFGPRRGAVTHVVILDGTMSTLEPGRQTHIGSIYKMLREVGAPVSIYYEPGLQWRDFASGRDVMTGRGINRQIRRAYGYLASRYHPGDRIFLFGYSRGAYAVRSLAGVIDMIGLLQAEHATERNIRTIYRHYQDTPESAGASAMRETLCHAPGEIEIEMIGAFDTVKSLGLNMPVLWRLSEKRHAFHNHELGHTVKAGFHALALDETRVAYTPVLWSAPDGYQGRVEQVWFPGSHGDVGGQLGGFEPARELSNISLVWMLERAQSAGLPLPEGWRKRFPCDVHAPSSGTLRGAGKWLVTRRPRKTMQNPSERMHESVALRATSYPARPGWWSWWGQAV